MTTSKPIVANLENLMEILPSGRFLKFEESNLKILSNL